LHLFAHIPAFGYGGQSTTPFFESEKLTQLDCLAANSGSDSLMLTHAHRSQVNDFISAHSVENIGRRFGVTRARVRQIEVKALGEMRRTLDRENSNGYSEH
jgi:hypothetical protein